MESEQEYEMIMSSDKCENCDVGYLTLTSTGYSKSDEGLKRNYQCTNCRSLFIKKSKPKVETSEIETTGDVEYD